jgi:hypothetical protein
MKRLGLICACISLLAGCARTTAPQTTSSETAVAPISSGTNAPAGPLLTNVRSDSTVLFAGHRVPDVVVTEAQWRALLVNTRNGTMLGYITLSPLDSRRVASTDSAGPPPRAIGKQRCHYRYLVLNHPEFLLATGVDSSFGGVVITRRCSP